ncbi:LysR family transcriptional regulator [Streptomyces armeniacus]|uniref:LysR family transcriptional regulator n=1 Tax=Streptomyces armeniacus TaxID=83291 RepID=A0A345XQE1_9ACTN|nr:LysR family transcriptional regulator [Streptomyces armeniacus]AXK33857.1 LysR family transcriptional regulator [Streptomyces armeniacus]
MDLQLRHLRNLCAIAAAGSLNRAAAGLGLPQPALSRQVRRVEELLGGALFERGSDGVRPTALGETVLTHAETIIRQFDELGHQVRHHQQHHRRTLRVAWSAGAMYEQLLYCLRRLCPDERLQIVAAGSSYELTRLLRDGEVDVALREQSTDRLFPCGDAVVEVPLAHIPVVAVLPERHRMASAARLSLADLADEEWISTSGPDRCHDFLNRLCGPYGFSPRVAYDIPVTGPRCEVVRHQRCVTLLQVSRALAPGVIQRYLPDLELSVRHSVAYRKDSRIAAYVPALVALLAQAYRVRASVCLAPGTLPEPSAVPRAVVPPSVVPPSVVPPSVVPRPAEGADRTRVP